MNEDFYRKFAAAARAQRDKLRPYLPTEVGQKLDAFEFLFRDSSPRPAEKELQGRLAEVVGVFAFALETAMASHGRIPALLDAKAQMPALSELLDKTLADVDLVSVWTQRLPRPAYDPRKAPIFIVSSWRSGSTLLSNVLNTHPNLAVLPEVDLIGPFIRNQYAVLNPDLPTLYRNPAPVVTAQMAATSVLGTTQDEFYAGFGNFIIDVCSRYAATKGKQRFVFKEPVDIPLLDLMDLLFGYHARFIWLVRHGFDVVASHLERYQLRCHPDISAFAQEWVTVNERLADTTELIGARSFKLRYEDLVAEPHKRVREVFEFLGERSDDEVMSRIEDWGTAALGGDHKILSSGGKIVGLAPPKWKKWPPVLLKQLSKVMNPTLVRAGYEPVQVPA